MLPLFLCFYGSFSFFLHFPALFFSSFDLKQLLILQLIKRNSQCAAQFLWTVRALRIERTHCFCKLILSPTFQPLDQLSVLHILHAFKNIEVFPKLFQGSNFLSAHFQLKFHLCHTESSSRFPLL